jgi:hypothetical protein
VAARDLSSGSIKDVPGNHAEDVGIAHIHVPPTKKASPTLWAISGH